MTEERFEIDVTPTWRGLAPLMIELVGGKAETEEGQTSAEEEFGRVFVMACNMATNHEDHEVRAEARACIFSMCDVVDRQNQRAQDEAKKATAREGATI